jgi:hypothetical protein
MKLAAGVAAIAAVGVLSASNYSSWGRIAVPADSLPSPAGLGAAEPNLAVGPDGHVYLSWHEPADSGHALKVAAFDGRTWSEARTVRTARDFFVNWADFPSVVVFEDGRLAAHWLQRTGSSPYAYGVRIAFSKDEGRTWSAPIIPHFTDSSTSTEHGFVSLWRDGKGMGAAWLDGRKMDKNSGSPTREMTLRGTFFNGDKPTLDGELDGRVCDCCQTSVAMTAKGPILVYRDRSPNEIRDIYYVRRLQSQGSGVLVRSWTKPVAVHNDGWKIDACPVNGPNVDAKGNHVALAWFTAANDSPRVKLAFSANAGERFGPPIRIDDGNPTGRVDVVALDDGGALVTWVERTRGDTAEVRLRRVYRGGKTGPATTVAASSAARASGFPRMAVTGKDVIFAWTTATRPSTIRLARMPVSGIR